MIMAFNCAHCDEPIVVIQDIPIKIDKAVLESGDILKLQEYILNILEEQFDIPSEITKIDITDPPEMPDIENELFDGEEEEEYLRPKNSPISKADINMMKDFLKNYKIQRNGSMFE